MRRQRLRAVTGRRVADCRGAVDQSAVDRQALEKPVTDFWAARTSSQNNGDTSPEQFAGLMSDAMIEIETGKVTRGSSWTS